MFIHTLAIRLKPDTTDAQQEQAKASLHALQGQIPGLQQVFVGRNLSPQQDDLLWVYEGLTDYHGDVFAARAGFRAPSQVIDALDHAAWDVDQPGRNWRPLQDTADAPRSCAVPTRLLSRGRAPLA